MDTSSNVLTEAATILLPTCHHHNLGIKAQSKSLLMHDPRETLRNSYETVWYGCDLRAQALAKATSVKWASGVM